MRALDRPRYRIDNAGHLLTERKKVDTAVRMLLEDGLKEVEKGSPCLLRSLYSEDGDRFFMLAGL